MMCMTMSTGCMSRKFLYWPLLQGTSWAYVSLWVVLVVQTIVWCFLFIKRSFELAVRPMAANRQWLALYHNDSITNAICAWWYEQYSAISGRLFIGKWRGATEHQAIIRIRYRPKSLFLFDIELELKYFQCSFPMPLALADTGIISDMGIISSTDQVFVSFIFCNMINVYYSFFQVCCLICFFGLVCLICLMFSFNDSAVLSVHHCYLCVLDVVYSCAYYLHNQSC